MLLVKNLAFLRYEFAGEGNDESIRDDSYPTCKKCVISVTDPGCLSRIPDPNFFHPGSWIRIKEFKYFKPKICFSALGNIIRVVHPGSRIQGSKCTGSRILSNKKGLFLQLG
jgi:hypothetical protein